jgi:hypothetical protein
VATHLVATQKRPRKIRRIAKAPRGGKEALSQATSETLESPEPEHELRYVDTRNVASDCSTLVSGAI